VLGAIGGVIVTHAVEIPALDGRSPLGFLAALGLLNVLSGASQMPVRLSFSPSTGVAVIDSPLTSLAEVTRELEIFVAAAAKDASIAGIDPAFPPHAGTGADPMRCERESYRALAAQVGHVDTAALEHWLPHLVTDLAVDRKGRAELTPFNAPSGKQNVRTFFAKPLEEVRATPSRLHEALVGWRRVAGFTGEYFDHHVINSAADDPLGTSTESGVPGATWLATMALPLLRVTGDGQNVAATLWHRSGRRFVMIWPLWRRPLDAPGVQALIEHPCLVPVDATLTVSRTDWGVLEIFGVYGAERQRIINRKFAGVLAPVAIPASG
jgi:hypothetical protein